MTDMRLIKESIALEQPCGSAGARTVVEGEITLPGGLREETRVLHAGGMASVEHVESMQDRLAVTGRVVFHALYTQGDHTKVNAMEATADFTHVLELPGVQSRSSCRAEAAVEHVDAAVSGGRLSLRGVVRLWGTAASQQAVEAVTGVQEVENGQTRAREIAAQRTVATGTGEALLREEFALPAGLQIRETLYATAQPRVAEVTGGMGRIGLSGQVQLEAVHASDMPGKPVVITRHEIPFEQAVELNGEEGELLQGHAVIRDVAVASQEAGEGERTLRTEVLLGLHARADRQESITLLEDAYTTKGEDLRMETAKVDFRTGESMVQAAESGKLTAILPEGSKPMRSVLCAFATPVFTGSEPMGGRTAVEGVLETTILYISDEPGVPVSATVEAPFRMTFAASLDGTEQIMLHCSDVEASAITSDRAEVRFILHMRAWSVQQGSAQLVTDVQRVSVPEPESGVVLYFIQPGESLWDVARRYRVAAQELKELNPEVKDEVHSGQGVVVWRR